MSTRHPVSVAAEAYIKLLQNPYARLSIEGDLEDPQPTVVTDEQKRAYFKLLQNPYAYDSIFGDHEDAMEPIACSNSQPILPTPQIGRASKEAFREGCRRVFLQYIPSEEGRVIRPHYRDFIVRNEGRSPEGRFEILKQLEVYDLSTSGSIKPHFNRGNEVFTEAKLRRIEQTVGAEEVE